MSVLLAIETSQRLGGVALRAADGVIHTEMLSPRKRHDDDLLPAIDRLFARLNLRPAALAAVGVSVGPGGFTGLRIAVTTAKMFAEGLGAKIIAVPSALVAAENDASTGPIIVALASKADTFWCTRLQRANGMWIIVGQPQVTDASRLDLTDIQAVLGDEHLPAGIRDMCEKKGVQVLQPVFDPAKCLVLAERVMAAGGIADPLLVQPLYPRPPEAVSLWEKAERIGKKARK